MIVQGVWLCTFQWQTQMMGVHSSSWHKHKNCCLFDFFFFFFPCISSSSGYPPSCNKARERKQRTKWKGGKRVYIIAQGGFHSIFISMHENNRKTYSSKSSKMAPLLPLYVFFCILINIPKREWTHIVELFFLFLLIIIHLWLSPLSQSEAIANASSVYVCAAGSLHGVIIISAGNHCCLIVVFYTQIAHIQLIKNIYRVAYIHQGRARKIMKHESNNGGDEKLCCCCSNG